MPKYLDQSDPTDSDVSDSNFLQRIAEREMGSRGLVSFEKIPDFKIFQMIAERAGDVKLDWFTFGTSWQALKLG